MRWYTYDFHSGLLCHLCKSPHLWPKTSFYIFIDYLSLYFKNKESSTGTEHPNEYMFCPLLLYPPLSKVEGGHTGFTLSVCISMGLCYWELMSRPDPAVLPVGTLHSLEWFWVSRRIFIYSHHNTFMYFSKMSVCPSVDRIVSALYLQQYLSDPFHIYTSYQATSEGVSLVKFISKFHNSEIWQIL